MAALLLLPASSSTRQIRKRQRRRTPSMMSHLLAFVCLLLCSSVQAKGGIYQHAGRAAQQSQDRQVQKYAVPAFSMLLKVRVDEVLGEDDDEIYLDLEIFQETLERVTQLHLTDIFQQADAGVEFDEQFLRIQLSTKLRQDLLMEPEHTPGQQRVHVPLHAGFSGVVSYSFPQGVLPSEDRMDQLIQELLETGLIAQNYMLLFRRYLSSGVLADIEDVSDIRIGTELLSIVEPPPKEATEVTEDKESLSNNSNKSTTKSKRKQLNAITIVAIVIFLTLSCLLMLFGATVFLLMKDRAKQERTYNNQTIASIGMGTSPKKQHKANHEEQGEEDDDDDHSVETIPPAWKRAVLPVLRKAIMVRRYWRKHVRKQRRNQKRHLTTPPTQDNPNEAASNNNNMVVQDDLDDDDSVNDEDLYYDEALSDEEAANQWLDHWTQSITSIPIRDIASSNTRANAPPGGSPNKKHVKKKKSNKNQGLAPRPATRQSKKAFLCCIAEEDSVVSNMEPEDLELAVSSPKNALMATPTRTTKICLELDRIEELASVIMEEEFPKRTPVSPTSSSSLYSASFPGASASSVRTKKNPSQMLPFDKADDEEEGRIHDVDLTY